MASSFRIAFSCTSGSVIGRLRSPDSTRRGKAPDVAFVCLDGVKLIDAPIIDLLPFEETRLIGCVTKQSASR